MNALADATIRTGIPMRMSGRLVLVGSLVCVVACRGAEFQSTGGGLDTGAGDQSGSGVTVVGGGIMGGYGGGGGMTGDVCTAPTCIGNTRQGSCDDDLRSKARTP